MRFCRLMVSKPIAILAIVVFVSGLALANPSPATIPFLNDTGTLTGYFQLDTSGTMTNFDFTTTAGALPAFHYTPSNSTGEITLFFGTDVAWIHSDQNQFGLSDGSDLLIELDCGGATNCFALAQDGMSFQINSASQEWADPDFTPGRMLATDWINVGDPPGGLSFSLGPTATGTPYGGGSTNPPTVPEPCSLLLIGSGLTVVAWKLRR